MKRTFVLVALGIALVLTPTVSQGAHDDVLIVVNDNSIDSPQVGSHYATQRGIDPANIVHLNVPPSYFIDWDNFRRLRDQIIQFMQENTFDDPLLDPVVCTDGDPPFYCQASMDQLRAHTTIRYLVTTRGLPTRTTVDGSTLYSANAPTSVDNYLKYWLVNYFSEDVQLKFTEREQAFGNGDGMREVIPAVDHELIVGRIDGIDLDSAKALVDRALDREQNGIYGKHYGSTNLFRWADGGFSGPAIYPPPGTSSLFGWRYHLGLFGEARAECIDYLDQPGSTAAGKSPTYCVVQLNEDSDVTGARYPAPGRAGSRQPMAFDALIYQGYLDGQSTVGSFASLMNWRKDESCTVTLCADAADPPACRAASIDPFREINTDCVGVAPGFIGYNHQSYPASYLAIWPTDWFQTTATTAWNNQGGGDINKLAFPEIREDEGFDDTQSLWFRNTDQVADPKCFPASDFSAPPSVECLDERLVVLSQQIPLSPQTIDTLDPQRYRVNFRYKTEEITQTAPIRVRFGVHEVTGANVQVDYGLFTVATMASGSTGWTLAEVEIPLDPALHAALDYDGIKIQINTGVFKGSLGIDAVSIQEVGTAVELTRNGSFTEGHRQVAAGDHAANFLNRLGGVAFAGSVSHHQSGGAAFVWGAMETLIYFLRGLPLGDAVWFDTTNNSGILYGDPVYSPVAIRILPINSHGTIADEPVDLSGHAVNGRDPASVVTSYQIDYCAGYDFFVCDQTPGAWISTGLSGSGGEDVSFGSLDLSASPVGPYVLRLAVTSQNVTTGKTQSLFDYRIVKRVLPGCAGSADDDGDGYCPDGAQPDCNDQAATAYPGAPELCDGLDNACTGSISPDETDDDGDLWVECSPWVGSGQPVWGGDDCDDADSATSPYSTEVNDGKDNQCPFSYLPGFGLIDELSTATFQGAPPAFCWPAQSGATGYRVAESADPTFPTGCGSTVITDTCFSPADPPAGTVVYLLARAETPNAGSWGVMSDDVERTSICP